MISLVSANGLKVYDGNQVITTLNQNKTFGVNKQITLTISNEEARNFSNIDFAESSIISMTPIDLASGENKTITANIITNSNYNGDLTLRGFYENTIGISNQTYDVNINYPNGLDICNLELIQGDTISWHNSFTDAVTIKNIDTGDNIFTIPAEQTYNKTFSSPVTLNYQVTYLTLPFTQICNIKVQPETGLVHSKDYDFVINTTITIIYEPTTLVANFLTTSYTLNYNQNTEDIFSIKNNGSKIAKNIHLSGDWIIFNNNDFDLNPGEQKNIGYTVQPQVFNESDTNKTYEKEITITGNFPIINQTISIFVPYFNIPSQFNNGTFDPEFMRNLYNFYCSVKPEDPICATYYFNSTNQGTNVQFSSEFVNTLFQKFLSLQNDFSSLSKNQLELLANQSQTNQNLLEKVTNLSNDYEGLKNSSESTSGVFLFVIIFIAGIILCTFAVLIWARKKGFIRVKAGFHKGEKP